MKVISALSFVGASDFLSTSVTPSSNNLRGFKPSVSVPAAPVTATTGAIAAAPMMDKFRALAKNFTSGAKRNLLREGMTPAMTPAKLLENVTKFEDIMMEVNETVTGAPREQINEFIQNYSTDLGDAVEGFYGTPAEGVFQNGDVFAQILSDAESTTTTTTLPVDHVAVLSGLVSATAELVGNAVKDSAKEVAFASIQPGVTGLMSWVTSDFGLLGLVAANAVVDWKTVRGSPHEKFVAVAPQIIGCVLAFISEEVVLKNLIFKNLLKDTKNTLPGDQKLRYKNIAGIINPERPRGECIETNPDGTFKGVLDYSMDAMECNTYHPGSQHKYGAAVHSAGWPSTHSSQASRMVMQGVVGATAGLALIAETTWGQRSLSDSKKRAYLEKLFLNMIRYKAVSKVQIAELINSTIPAESALVHVNTNPVTLDNEWKHRIVLTTSMWDHLITDDVHATLMQSARVTNYMNSPVFQNARIEAARKFVAKYQFSAITGLLVAASRLKIVISRSKDIMIGCADHLLSEVMCGLGLGPLNMIWAHRVAQKWTETALYKSMMLRLEPYCVPMCDTCCGGRGSFYGQGQGALLGEAVAVEPAAAPPVVAPVEAAAPPVVAPVEAAP